MADISHAELLARVDQGLIKRIPHPTLPLVLWHYTEHNIYSVRNWDYYTMAARGLVTTGDGPTLTVVAKPYTKFFNVGEIPETLPDHLPALPYECTEKVDGSLIMNYAFRGQIMTHTKGAWDNEQSERARAHIAACWRTHEVRRQCIDRGMTLLAEITYPGNAAVQYGPDTNLQLIGAIQPATNQDLFHQDLAALAEVLGCPCVRLYKDMGLQDIFAYDTPGIEGFVVRFANGLRVKVKTDWFKSVFRVRYYWSEGRILALLAMGEPVDTTAVDLPADERVVVSELLEQLHVRYNTVEAAAQALVQDLDGLTRKEQAQRILAQSQALSSVCFAMLSGKNYTKIIWKHLQDSRAPVF